MIHPGINRINWFTFHSWYFHARTAFLRPIQVRSNLAQIAWSSNSSNQHQSFPFRWRSHSRAFTMHVFCLDPIRMCRPSRPKAKPHWGGMRAKSGGRQGECFGLDSASCLRWPRDFLRAFALGGRGLKAHTSQVCPLFLHFLPHSLRVLILIWPPGKLGLPCLISCS